MHLKSAVSCIFLSRLSLLSLSSSSGALWMKCRGGTLNPEEILMEPALVWLEEVQMLMMNPEHSLSGIFYYDLVIHIVHPYIFLNNPTLKKLFKGQIRLVLLVFPNPLNIYSKPEESTLPIGGSRKREKLTNCVLNTNVCCSHFYLKQVAYFLQLNNIYLDLKI